ncbi:MAG TPA: bifunctional diaminohydroxyphosphoribosylaminopyrimidine deaminase/5-amino-6-(5-phosphoribosylamino)uracil reductase RibD [Planctomycetaceae bacterium]|nr:bifunctional diaminohydroxyphosphoribosylaminopyrimidine deaminase/5-amino-6-(5-phosphoribosylamino)uracil reductase RibD [Planctomycetaceae bacterium]
MSLSPEIARETMKRAIALASRGVGHAEPNPMVGCVILDSAGIIAEGYHRRCGGPHAERDALANVADADRGRLADSTMVVTLEPCCHHGRTPPCTDAILEAGIRRVVVGMLDPYEEVAGRGVKLLREHGVRVEVLNRDDVRELNHAYLTRVTKQRPWVIAKWAMTLDGKIATRLGDSQWISSAASRQWVHQLRSRMDAIVVGRRTAELDDPSLTVRGIDNPPRTPVRVVVDSQLRLSPTSKLAQTARVTPTVLWCGSDASNASQQRLEDLGVVVRRSDADDSNGRLPALLRWLAKERQATNILVEGGGQILGSLLDQKLIDQCEVFVGAKIVGGANAATPVAGLGFERLKDTPGVEIREVEQLEADIRLSCRLNW